MSKNSTHVVAALYDAHKPAADAVRALERTGFDLRRLSIVGRDFETEAEEFLPETGGRRTRMWDRRATFWADMRDKLSDSGLLLVPGAGSFLAAGPVVARVGAALQEPLPPGRDSALSVGFIVMGVAEASVAECESRVRAGGYVVIAQFRPDEDISLAGHVA